MYLLSNTNFDYLKKRSLCCTYFPPLMIELSWSYTQGYTYPVQSSPWGPDSSWDLCPSSQKMGKESQTSVWKCCVQNIKKKQKTKNKSGLNLGLTMCTFCYIHIYIHIYMYVCVYVYVLEHIYIYAPKSFLFFSVNRHLLIKNNYILLRMRVILESIQSLSDRQEHTLGRSPVHHRTGHTPFTHTHLGANEVSS